MEVRLLCCSAAFSPCRLALGALNGCSCRPPAMHGVSNSLRECSSEPVRHVYPCAGNYDTYIRTRQEQEDAQMKQYRW